VVSRGVHGVVLEPPLKTPFEDTALERLRMSRKQHLLPAQTHFMDLGPTPSLPPI
jgi:hypothetical protein